MQERFKLWREQLLKLQSQSKQETGDLQQYLNRQRTKFEDARLLKGFGSLSSKRRLRAIETYHSLPGERKIAILRTLLQHEVFSGPTLNCLCTFPALALFYFVMVVIISANLESLNLFVVLISIPGIWLFISTIIHHLKKQRTSSTFLNLLKSTSDTRIVPCLVSEIFQFVRLWNHN